MALFKGTDQAKLDEILKIVRASGASADNPRYSREPAPIEKIDPTLNVKEAMAAESKRQDELRLLESSHAREIAALRDTCTHEIAAVRLKAQEDLAAAESRRIDALALAEQRRIDAKFSASENAVLLASTRQELTATALAERVDTSAKALAASVIASAEALGKQVAAQSGVFDTRLTRLEQQGYESGGRDTQRLESRTSAQWTTGTIISTLTGFIAIASLLFYVLGHH